MKKPYETLRKEYSWPDLRQWVEIEDETTIAAVRAAFSDKLVSFVDLIETLINPEGLVAMSEAQVFSEAEHEALQTIYHRLVLLHKDCLLIDIAATESETLAMTERLIKEWPAIVRDVKHVVEKTKAAYAIAPKGPHPASYLG